MIAYEILSGAWSGRTRSATGPLSASWFVTDIAPPALSGGQYAVPSSSGWVVRTAPLAISAVTPERVLSKLTLDAAGGVPDYVGTPQYDGGDAARVRCTDNTAALKTLIENAIQQQSRIVKIPAGHWGIKLGDLKFEKVKHLRIVGDGIGVTTLDFVFEDASGDSYVSDAEAHAIAEFVGAERVEFSDLTIKATTKGGLVTGSPGSNDVYRGKVWGLKFNNCKEVVFNRVRVERFNYRGVSVYGADTERVKLTQCEGFFNVGSGFWISNARKFIVDGGEFAHNGVPGETGTGYGVTASSYVGEFLCKRVHAHHNYRKGVDSHGCAKFVVKHSEFNENVLDHVAFVNNFPPVGTTDADVRVVGNSFNNGKTADARDWLAANYAALAANGYGSDASAAGSAMTIGDASNTIKSVAFERNSMGAHFNGVGGSLITKSRPVINIVTPAASVEFAQNRIDTQHCVLGSDTYSRFIMAVVGANVALHNNSVRATMVTHNGSDYGVLFEFSRLSPTLWLVGNDFLAHDAVFMASTYQGVRSPVLFDAAGSRRLIVRNTWDYAINPYGGAPLANQYFLGGAEIGESTLVESENVVVVAGEKI